MRLIRGRNGWWCVAPSGVALVPASLVHDGALTDVGAAQVDRSGILSTRAVSHYSLTVLTSTDCNLGCPYCFQNTGPARTATFSPPRIRRTAIGPDVVDATVAFVRGRMADAGLTRLHLVLFGGEPLLNPLGCRHLLDRCGELGELTASMISNGVLLTRRRAVELYAAGLRAVQVTLDGPAEVHDSVRTTRNGGPTFDRILANVAAAQEATGIRFTFRVHATPRTLGGLVDLVAAMAARVDAGRCGFAVAPVSNYGWGVDAPSRWSSRTVLAAYASAQEHGFRVVRPRLPYCGFCSEPGGRYGAVVNADGTLYSCWDTAGRDGFAVGTVTDGYDDDTTDRWVRCGGPDRTFLDEIDAGLLDMVRDLQRR